MSPPPSRHDFFGTISYGLKTGASLPTQGLSIPTNPPSPHLHGNHGPICLPSPMSCTVYLTISPDETETFCLTGRGLVPTGGGGGACPVVAAYALRG